MLCLLAYVEGYVIDRHKCAVNIDGHLYNISEISSEKQIFNVVQNNWTYYFTICSELAKDDLPPWNTLSPKGYSSARCNKNNQIYQLLNSYSSFDYKPLNNSDFQSGLVYRSNGEPLKTESEILYSTFDVIHQIACDATKTDARVKPEISFEDNDQEIKIYLKYTSKYGCPQDVPKPEPTTEFTPDCRFRFRSVMDRTFGIDLNLFDMNGGPGGIMVPLNVSGNNMTLFYQPCERMKCPHNSKCDTDDYSSAWICDSSDSCTSFGLANDNIKAETLGEVWEGVKIIHENQDKWITLELRQSQYLPKGHIEFDYDAYYETQNNIIIKGRSKNMILEPIDDPIIPLGGKCSFQTSEGTKAIYLELTDMKSKNGHVSKISVKNDQNDIEYFLKYQPCGFMDCPSSDADCDGDIDATVWLCREKLIGGKTICDGYGLFENSIEAGLTNSSFGAGIDVTYRGDDKRKAVVHFTCDSTLNFSELRMPTEAELSDNTLKFEVMSKGACIQSGTIFVPPTPTKGLTPTPTPIASPNPRVYQYNETHYRSLNLNLTATVIDEALPVHAQGYATGRMNWRISHWAPLKCPKDYECPIGDESNAWGCWEGKCFDLGNKHIGVTSPGRSKTVEGAFPLHFKGVFGYGTEFRIRCDRASNDSLIRLDDYAVSYGLDAIAGRREYSLGMRSGGACPSEFVQRIPAPRETPAPDPSFVPPRRIRSLEYNGTVVELDLDLIKPVSDFVVLDHGGVLERALIYFVPGAPRECPRQYVSEHQRLANVWKCFPRSKRCFATGSNEHGLFIELINDFSTQNIGLPRVGRATYSGGVGGLKTRVVFLCNESLAGYEDSLIAEENPQESEDVVEFTVFTRQMCPHDIDDIQPGPGEPPRRTPAGAYVLLALEAAAYLLALFVVLRFILSGEIRVPSWVALFFGCVCDGFWFVFSCGRNSACMSKRTYDSV